MSAQGSRFMQAIILAAGMGKRLKHLTQSNTKCMVKVNNQTLIERMLNQLDSINLSKIIIVVGYKGQKLIEYISSLNITTEIQFINNPIYDKTNNIYSLSLAKKNLLDDDTILLESDLILDNDIIYRIICDSRPSLAVVDKYECWMDGTCIELDEDDNIVSFIPNSQFDYNRIDQLYKTVNIYKFSKTFATNCYVPFLEAYQKVLGLNEYYEQVLRVISLAGNHDLKALRLNGENWYEIDDLQDLDIASSIFSTDSERYKSMNRRHGGFWRYPKINDFCYLVNPGYPSSKMISEIQVNLKSLMTKYPSSLEVNSLLVSKMFDIELNHIVVGNGVSELLKAIIDTNSERIGLIIPSSFEFPNNITSDHFSYCSILNDYLSYSSTDIISFIKNQNIKTMVLMNPDNVSGNYIPKEDIISLLTYANEHSVKIIIDETATDYVDEECSSLLTDEILNRYSNLVVLKSISDSHGISGLRLGILSTSDENYLKKIKTSLPLWNINSLSEFYLQIMEKYKKSYIESINNVKEERRYVLSILCRLNHVTVLPSQGNHITLLFKDGILASNVSKHLLIDYNIYVKDLNGITNKDCYLRFSIKNRNDNDILINALEEILNNPFYLDLATKGN